MAILGGQRSVSWVLPLISLTLILWLLLIQLGSAKMIHVPQDYPTIQAAIDAARPGDTILVAPGGYRENLVIDKQGIKLICAQPWECSITYGRGAWEVFHVTASRVTIAGFRIFGMLEPHVPAILLDGDQCVVQDNLIEWAGLGIYSIGSRNSMLRNFINSTIGILLVGSGSWVEGNIASVSLGGRAQLLLNNTIKWLEFSCAAGAKLRNNTISSISILSVCPWMPSRLKLPEILFHDIDPSNLIRGKPIYYLVNCSDLEIPRDAGFVALVNCTNVTVKDLVLEGNQPGLLIAYTNRSRLENLSIRHLNATRLPILMLYSNQNSILNSKIYHYDPGHPAIRLLGSNWNLIANNSIYYEQADYPPGYVLPDPIWIHDSHGNLMINNSFLPEQMLEMEPTSSPKPTPGFQLMLGLIGSLISIKLLRKKQDRISGQQNKISFHRKSLQARKGRN